MLLADEGYDVWLTNFRGSTSGHAHRFFSPQQYEFWDFSWDEMAKYDLTSIFELVFAKTEQRFLYIGHSMGTTAFFAHMSMYPENIKYCKAMYALAPVCYMNHVRGALNLFVPYVREIEVSRLLFGRPRALISSFPKAALTCIELIAWIYKQEFTRFRKFCRFSGYLEFWVLENFYQLNRLPTFSLNMLVPEVMLLSLYVKI